MIKLVITSDFAHSSLSSSLNASPPVTTSKYEESFSIILDDCISSELLHVKYSSESFIISYLSNFETLLSTHDTNQLINDQTLSNSIQRIMNMYCTPPNQTNFSFLSNITEPAVILYWIAHVSQNQKKFVLPKAYPFLSASVKQDDHVIKNLAEYCDFMLDELDFEKLDISLIHRIFNSSYRRDLTSACTKLTMDQIITLIQCSNCEIFAHIPSNYVNDHQFWLECKSWHKFSVFENNFTKITQETRNNKDIMLACLDFIDFVNQKQYIYANISKELQNDVDICCEIVGNGFIPPWLSKDMKTNRTVLLTAVKSKYNNYEKLPKELQQDPEFLLLIVKSSIDLFLKYNIHNDVDFLYKAVSISDRKLFKHLSESIRNDKEFVMKLLHEKTWLASIILENLGQELRNDKEFILYLMKNDPTAFEYGSETIRNDPEVYNQAITSEYHFWSVFEFLPEHLKTDFNLILKHASSSLISTMYDCKIIPPENIRNYFH